MENTRRDFLKTTGGIAAASAFIGAPLIQTSTAAAAEHAGERTQHELPPLPYDYDALEPYIDAQTMELHHSMHHQGYVNGLNNAEEALATARAEDDFSLIQHWSRQAAFHGGGHWLHSMFWQVMAPPDNGGGGEPTGALAEKIEEDFGSFEHFKNHFSAAAGAVEGGGWGLLHVRFEDQRLLVLQAENQHKLSPWNTLPILGIDVWEHAYYLNYQNRRGEYVENWWNVVNWAQVAENFEAVVDAVS
ncbi:MAG: Fe-Mn family superoxide dismutase [Candidatus Hydrogenedentota bacterium]